MNRSFKTVPGNASSGSENLISVIIDHFHRQTFEQYFTSFHDAHPIRKFFHQSHRMAHENDSSSLLFEISENLLTFLVENHITDSHHFIDQDDGSYGLDCN